MKSKIFIIVGIIWVCAMLYQPVQSAVVYWAGNRIFALETDTLPTDIQTGSTAVILKTNGNWVHKIWNTSEWREVGYLPTSSYTAPWPTSSVPSLVDTSWGTAGRGWSTSMMSSFAVAGGWATVGSWTTTPVQPFSTITIGFVTTAPASNDMYLKRDGWTTISKNHDHDLFSTIAKGYVATSPATATGNSFLTANNTWQTLPVNFSGFPLQFHVNLATNNMGTLTGGSFHMGHGWPTFTATTTNGRVYVPQTGQVVRCNIKVSSAGTVGWGSTPVVAELVVNSTATTIAAATWGTVDVTATEKNWHNDSLGIAVSHDDHVSIRFRPLSWQTAPTNLTGFGSCFVRID